MMAGAFTLVWLAAPLMLGVLVAGAAALLARSLFVTSVCACVAGAMGSVLLVLLGAGAGALTLALVVGAWAPLLLLAAMLLSKRTAKGMARRPWLSIVATTAAACVLAWVGAAIGPGAATQPAPVGAGIAYWLTLLALTLAALCAGLLGPGERGVLETDAAT